MEAAGTPGEVADKAVNEIGRRFGPVLKSEHVTCLIVAAWRR